MRRDTTTSSTASLGAWADCPRCDGWGIHVEPFRECTTCDGTGRLPKDMAEQVKADMRDEAKEGDE